MRFEQDEDQRDTELQAYFASSEALALVQKRFIDPYSRWMTVSGTNGMTAQWKGDPEILEKIQFPSGFAASYPRSDVGALQHEMSHFITVSQTRCVRTGFGFGGGMPDLGMLGLSYIREPFYAASAIVEAKAVAWEAILLRDLHGVECSLDYLVSSLKEAKDFSHYEGRTSDEKLSWITTKVKDYVDAFGGLEDFERLWVDRCEKLPDLFHRETVRHSLWRSTPVEVVSVPYLTDDWTATIKRYAEQGVEDVIVSLDMIGDDDRDHSTFESFSTMAAALKWVEAVKTYHMAPDASCGNAGPSI